MATIGRRAELFLRAAWREWRGPNIIAAKAYSITTEPRAIAGGLRY
jgi:hypothetical protein